MGKTEGGGGTTGWISIGLCLILSILLGGTVYYLETKSEKEVMSLRVRIDILSQELASLQNTVNVLNNRTIIYVTSKEKEAHRRDDVNNEEDEYYTGDYDDPNADDSEYEEDEDDYDNVRPVQGAALHATNTETPLSSHHMRHEHSTIPEFDADKSLSKSETRRKRASILLKQIIKNFSAPQASLGDTSTVNQNSTGRLNASMSQMKTELFSELRRHRIINSTVLPLDLIETMNMERRKYSPNRIRNLKTEHHSNRRKRAGHREDVEIFTNPEFSPVSETVAAHFSADESKCLQNIRHRHCDHNHRRFHPNQELKDWQSSGFMNLLPTSRTFNLIQGILTVDTAGIYFIYAQIFYLDTHDVSGFRIYQNNQPIIQCTSHTSHGNNSDRHVHKRNSCFTGSLVHLRKGDQLSLKETEENRYTSFERTKSFFGLFKVGSI